MVQLIHSKHKGVEIQNMDTAIYADSYPSPIGSLLLLASNTSLIGLYFERAIHTLNKNVNILSSPPLHHPITRTKTWLECYFLHKIPTFTPPIQLIGTPFMQVVWKVLLKIPYGTTRTYGELAKIVRKHRNIPRMSAQAIGGALKKNPISIIVPCHRVIGANGKLTGYAGGLDRKQFLLQLEKEVTKTVIKN